jgi:hypothetical protein
MQQLLAPGTCCSERAMLLYVHCLLSQPTASAAVPAALQKSFTLCLSQPDCCLQVTLRPRMQRALLPGPARLDNTSLLVPEALGSVTALSGCPAGTFLAAGTSR